MKRAMIAFALTAMIALPASARAQNGDAFSIFDAPAQDKYLAENLSPNTQVDSQDIKRVINNAFIFSGSVDALYISGRAWQRIADAAINLAAKNLSNFKKLDCYLSHTPAHIFIEPTPASPFDGPRINTDADFASTFQRLIQDANRKSYPACTGSMV